MDGKLVSLLKTFSKIELNRLKDFIYSPYFNKQKYVTGMFDEIIKHYPEFSSENFTKEKIYAGLYPGKPYNDTRFRNLASDLNFLIENFITAEGLKKDKFSSQLYFLESLPEKQLDGIFRKKYSKAAYEIETNSVQNENYYFDRFRLYQTRSIFVNRRLPNDAKENSECYQGIVNESVKFFLAVVFKNYSLMLNKNITFFKYNYDTKFINIILDFMKEHTDDYKNDTCILLYYYFTVFYLKYDEASFKTLENFVLSNLNKLDPFDAANSIINLNNYCRRKALEGIYEYEKKALSLYKFGLENNIWNENVKIRPAVFRTIVSIACNCEDFEWCEHFIYNYKDLQIREHVNSNVNLCLGRLYFDKKEYETALVCLSKVQPLDSTYKYETDTLIIRIFYETHDIEPYFSKVKAFKKWVNNNKTVISERYKSMFNLMADYFERLMNLKLKPDEFISERMYKEIEENKTLVNRLWFLKKLSEMRKTA